MEAHFTHAECNVRTSMCIYENESPKNFYTHFTEDCTNFFCGIFVIGTNGLFKRIIKKLKHYKGKNMMVRSSTGQLLYFKFYEYEL